MLTYLRYSNWIFVMVMFSKITESSNYCWWVHMNWLWQMANTVDFLELKPKRSRTKKNTLVVNSETQQLFSLTIFDHPLHSGFQSMKNHMPLVDYNSTFKIKFPPARHTFSYLIICATLMLFSSHIYEHLLLFDF